MHRLLVGLVLLSSSSAWAIPRLYLPDDINGARSLGMGDAFRGVGTSNDAIVENPSALVITPHYEIAGFFAWDTAAPAAYWNASIVDATTLPLALGVSYSHVGSGDGDVFGPSAPGLSDRVSRLALPDFGRYVGSSTRVALAYPLSDVLSIGLNADWLLFGGDLAQNGNWGQTSAITGGAAIAIHTSQFTISGIGYNLIPVGLADQLAPRRFALGASYGTDTTFRIDVDGVATLSQNPSVTAFDLHSGAEVFLGQLIAIRGGYFYSGLTQTNFGSLGVGVVFPSIAIDVAYRQSIGVTWDGGNWSDHLFLGSLRIFLPG